MVIKRRRSDTLEATWIDGIVGARDQLHSITSDWYINQRCKKQKTRMILRRLRSEVRNSTIDRGYPILFRDLFYETVGKQHLQGKVNGLYLIPSFHAPKYKSLVNEFRTKTYDVSALRLLNFGPQHFGSHPLAIHRPRRRVYRQMVLRYTPILSDLVNKAIGEVTNQLNTVITEIHNRPEELQSAYLNELNYVLDRAVSVPFKDPIRREDDLVTMLETTGYIVQPML